MWLTRPLPPLFIWLAAAALEIAPIETGSVIIDEFASRFVYFYTGYLFAPAIFRLAANVRMRPVGALIPYASNARVHSDVQKFFKSRPVSGNSGSPTPSW